MGNRNTRMKSLDVLRGWCMIAILFFHTQIYYLGDDAVPYTMYVPNALALFYLTAGFFAHRRPQSTGEILRHIFSRLVVPYIIFTLILGVVKQFIIMDYFSIRVLASNILSGRASWFIAALIIIEVIMLFVRKICKDSSWAILLAGLAGMVIAYFIQRAPGASSNFVGGIPFAIPPALLGLFFYAIGILFQRHLLPLIPKPSPLGYVLRNGNSNCDKVRRTVRYTWYWLIPVLLAFFFIKIWEAINGYEFLFASLWANPYWLFILDMLLGSVGIISLFVLLWPDTHIQKKDESLKIGDDRIYHFMSPAWIGMNCLVFYFFAGAVPMAVTLFFKKTLFATASSVWYSDPGFWLCLIAIIAVTSAIALTIYTWLPFLIGKTKKDNK